MKSRNAVLNLERAPKAVSKIVFQSDIAEEHKESNLEAAFDCRLVSRPRNALSLDGIPGDSQRIVARPLDRVVPDYAGILLAAADPRTDEGAPKEINNHREMRRPPRGLVLSRSHRSGRSRANRELAVPRNS